MTATAATSIRTAKRLMLIPFYVEQVNVKTNAAAAAKRIAAL
jgi:hypothetical protein